MRTKLLFVSLLAVAVAIGFFVWRKGITSISAQTATIEQSIEISPPSLELEVNPGQTTTITTKVRNKGNIAYEMTPRIEDFTASGEEGQVELIDKGPWAISSWSDITPKSFTLDPKQEQDVQVTINVPPQNIGGGKYGAIVFSVQGKASANTAAVNQEIASLFLLRVSGPVQESLQAVDFTAPSFIEFGPVPLSLRLQNTGNVHVRTTGVISIMNMLGKKVADLVIPPTNVFPQAKRVITTSFEDQFLIGPYQAVAIVYYGTGNQSITTYTPFFAFPVRIVAGIVILILVLFIIRKYTQRKRRIPHAKK